MSLITLSRCIATLITIATSILAADPPDMCADVPKSANASIPTRPFSVPFFGPPENTSTPWLWGINTNSGNALPRIYVSADPERSDGPAFIQNASEYPFELSGVAVNRFQEDPHQELQISLDTGLTVHYKDCLLNEIDSVPFGIQLGYALNNANDAFYNGSLTFNGYFDSNRLNSTSWMLLPNATDLNKNTTFLSGNGTVQFRANVHASNSEGSSDGSLTARLAFYEKSIVLPSGYPCSNLSIEPQNTTSSYPIRIPDYLLTEAHCRIRDTGDQSPDNNVVVLGHPFFQAAYLYVVRSGQVYIGQGNDFDLPPNPVQFDAEAQIQTPAQPNGYEIPKSAGSNVKLSWTGLSTVFASLLFALFDGTLVG